MIINNKGSFSSGFSIRSHHTNRSKHNKRNSNDVKFRYDMRNDVFSRNNMYSDDAPERTRRRYCQPSRPTSKTT